MLDPKKIVSAFKKQAYEEEDDSVARENTDEFYGKLGHKTIVVMKSTGPEVKQGDILLVGRGGIVGSWIKNSGSYVDMIHGFGSQDDWSAVGLQMDFDKYMEETENRKEIGEDTWQISYLLDSLKAGAYKFTERHDKLVKWLEYFVEQIDESEDDSSDSDESED